MPLLNYDRLNTEDKVEIHSKTIESIASGEVLHLPSSRNV